MEGAGAADLPLSAALELRGDDGTGSQAQLGAALFSGGLEALPAWEDELLLLDAPAAVAATSPRRLRCLDATHASGCTQCTPPPTTPAECALTVLNCAVGGLHGLRALLLLTPEWNCARERDDTAAALEAAGDALGMAPLLRGRASSKLTKEQLLQLCFSWGYAHHAWRRKGDGERKRRAKALAPSARVAPRRAAAGAGTSHAALAAPPLRVARGMDSVLLRAFDGASLAQFVEGPLGGAVAACCACIHGVRAHAAVETHRTLHCARDAPGAYDLVSAACGKIAERLVELQRAQAAWSCGALARAAADGRHAAAAAWQTLPLLDDAVPVEVILAIVREAFAMARRLHDLLLTSMAGAVVMCGVVRLACDENLAGITAGELFVTAASATLAAARLDAELGQYVAACDAVVAECVRFAGELRSALQARAAWSRRVLEPGYCADMPFTLPRGQAMTSTFCDRLVVTADVAAAQRAE